LRVKSSYRNKHEHDEQKHWEKAMSVHFLEQTRTKNMKNHNFSFASCISTTPHLGDACCAPRSAQPRGNVGLSFPAPAMSVDGDMENLLSLQI
jgi:hypothetical protein